MEIGEYVEARQAFEETREIFQSLGYQRGVALAIHNLGETAYKMGELQMPGNTSPNPFVFANIWACHEAILTLLNFSPRSTKRKGATNKRFNSWRQPRPCGFALARRSNKSHRSMSRLY
jgi:hypothetical protein